ncbi:MAG: hypothetical protein AAGE03_11805 [Pseudomonadota bacterium]
MSDTGLDRRVFLGLTLAAASSGPGLASHSDLLISAARIGREVLATGALPADPKALRNRLGGHEASVDALFTEDWHPFIQEDFAAGRTIDTAGWALSRTEAVLCALAALSEGAA